MLRGTDTILDLVYDYRVWADIGIIREETEEGGRESNSAASW